MYGDIIAGLSYAKSSSPLLGLIIMAFIPILFGMSLYALMPAWARETLDVQSDNLGVLYAVMGIGALIGSLGLAQHSQIQTVGDFCFFRAASSGG